MKAFIKIVLLFILPLLLTFSCNDEDDIAESLLFSDDSAMQPGVELFMTLVDGWILSDGDVLYGLEIRVDNQNSMAVTAVTIKLNAVSPVAGVEDDSGHKERRIEYIAPFGSASPDNYWCFDCNTAQEVYVGHFYVTLAGYISGGQTYAVSFDIELFYNGNKYNVESEQTFTTLFSPSKDKDYLQNIW